MEAWGSFGNTHREIEEIDFLRGEVLRNKIDWGDLAVEGHRESGRTFRKIQNKEAERACREATQSLGELTLGQSMPTQS